MHKAEIKRLFKKNGFAILKNFVSKKIVCWTQAVYLLFYQSDYHHF